MSDEKSTIERINALQTLPPALRDTEAHSIKEDVLAKCGECKSQSDIMGVLDNEFGKRTNNQFSRAYDATYLEAINRYKNLPLK